MYRIETVNASFIKLGKYEQYQVPTGKTKKALFGLMEVDETETRSRWVETGQSDCFIDSARLAADLESCVDALASDGYEIVSITPVISGDYAHQHEGSRANNGVVTGGYGFGYGYSFTSSLIVTAKRNPKT